MLDPLADATLPKFLVRAHGPDVNKGLVYAINPVVVIGAVPLLSAYLSNQDAFSQILLGAYISATSPIYLVWSDSVLAAALFVLHFSVGEAVWSPRYLEYQVSIAPEGREAVFMAIATAPMYLSKLPAGVFSGYLLQTYMAHAPVCPPGATTCAQWLVTGAASCASEMAALALGPACDLTCGRCAAGDPGCADTLTKCPPSTPRSPHYMWFLILASAMCCPLLMHAFQDRLREPGLGGPRYTELKRNDSADSMFDGSEAIQLARESELVHRKEPGAG